MFARLSPLLLELADSFARQASFHWFVIAVVGLLVRLDHHGVSSTIRWFWLSFAPRGFGSPRCFTTGSFSWRPVRPAGRAPAPGCLWQMGSKSRRRPSGCRV